MCFLSRQLRLLFAFLLSCSSVCDSEEYNIVVATSSTTTSSTAKRIVRVTLLCMHCWEEKKTNFVFLSHHI